MNPQEHLQEIKSQIEAMHYDGHLADDPCLYLQVTLMERALSRAFQELTIFRVDNDVAVQE